jgi:hypothetical protein
MLAGSRTVPSKEPVVVVVTVPRKVGVLSR